MIYIHICVSEKLSNQLQIFSIHLDMCNLYVVPECLENIYLFGILLLL